MRTNVARGTLLGIVGQAWHLLTAFLLYAFLARSLGPAQFGHWRVVLSVLVWFEIFVNSGLVKVTTKAITEAPANRARLTRAAYLGQFAIAAVLFTLMMLLAGPIAALLSDPSLASLLRIAALDIPLYGVFMIASSIVLGQQRFERQAAAWTIYATAKFIAIAVLVLVGFSVQGALVGNAVSSLVGFAAVFAPWKEGTKGRGELAGLSTHMLAASAPFLVLALAEGLAQSADLWVVSALLSNSVTVGLYAAATALAEVPVFLFAGLDRVIFPSVAQAGADEDSRLVGHYAVQGVRLALIVTMLGIAVVAATGRQLLELIYSQAYLGAFVPLVILIVAAAGRTIRATCSEVLMAQNRRRTATTVMVAALVAEIALLALLVPRYGLTGAAAAAAVAAIAAAGSSAMLLRSQLGRRPLLTSAKCAAAAMVIGVALALLTPSAPLALLVAYPIAAVVYLLLLRAFGEIDATDIVSLKSVFGR